MSDKRCPNCHRPYKVANIEVFCACGSILSNREISLKACGHCCKFNQKTHQGYACPFCGKEVS